MAPTTARRAVACQNGRDENVMDDFQVSRRARYSDQVPPEVPCPIWHALVKYYGLSGPGNGFSRVQNSLRIEEFLDV